MAWEILIHPEVALWLEGLSEKEYEKVIATMQALAEIGPALGRPHVDRIKHSRLHNLKELRPLGSSLRILFAFDFQRRATLLAAGDKSSDWGSWYRINIPIAEKRFIELSDKNKKEE